VERGVTTQTVSNLGVLLMLLAADKYPRYSNHDWRVAEIMEAEALILATNAMPSHDDPPELPCGWRRYDIQS
jgi:hypothetical protein